MKIWISIIAIFSIIGCRREPEPDPMLKWVSRRGYLIGGVWGLTSETILDEWGNVKSVYKGTTADSLIFNWQSTYNANVLLTTIDSYFKSEKMQYQYQFFNNGPASCYITCQPTWKNEPGYADTLLVTSVDDQLLVFQVKYKNATGSGVEIDSLRKIRYRE